jgi:hypothetical protein
MKFTTLLSLLVIGASVATMAQLSKASDATVYRSGDFGRANVEMTSCVGYVLVKRHPELHYVTGSASGGASWSGAWSTSTGRFIWTITAKPIGPKSSYVELRNTDARSEVIREVWQAIEGCAKQ